MTTAQLALLVSGGSLALSLLAFCWTIGWSIWSHRRLHNPRLHVVANFAYPIVGGTLGPDCINVSLANVGAIPVSIETLTLRVRSDARRPRRNLLPMEWKVDLPRPLAVGATWRAPLVLLADLRQGLEAEFPDGDWRLVAVVTDPTGREYTARVDVTPQAE